MGSIFQSKYEPLILVPGALTQNTLYGSRRYSFTVPSPIVASLSLQPFIFPPVPSVHIILPSSSSPPFRRHRKQVQELQKRFSFLAPTQASGDILIFADFQQFGEAFLCCVSHWIFLDTYSDSSGLLWSTPSKCRLLSERPSARATARAIAHTRLRVKQTTRSNQWVRHHTPTFLVTTVVSFKTTALRKSSRSKD